MNPDIKILCQAYEFTNKELSPEQYNYFNPDCPKIPVGSEIDLANPYLISLDRLSFNRTTADNSSELPVPVFEYGDLKFKLSGIFNNKFLIDYFLFLDITDSFAYRKYYIKFYYNSVLKFEGFIDNELLHLPYLNKVVNSELKTIEVTAFNKLKELKSFWSNKPLPQYTDYIAQSNPFSLLLWWNDLRTEHNHTPLCSSAPIDHFLSWMLDIFVDTPFNFLPYVWQICYVPQFYKSINYSDYWFIKSGYMRWLAEGITINDFVNYLCNAMGWQLDYKNNFLYLKNRSDFSGDIQYLDFNKVNSLDIGSKSAKGIRHIVIPDGTIDSPNHYTPFSTVGSEMSKRFKMISNYAAVNNHTNFFQWVEGYSGIGGNAIYHIYLNDNFPYSVKLEESNDKFSYADAYITEQHWLHYHFNNHFINRKNSLILNAGEQTVLKTVCDPISTHNYPAINVGQSYYDFMFSGNVGSCMVVRSQDGNHPVLDYHEYCKSDTFKNNFISLLEGRSNKVITIEYNDIIDDPDKTFEFINTPESFFDSQWTPNSIEVDYLNKISKLIIVRK